MDDMGQEQRGEYLYLGYMIVINDLKSGSTVDEGKSIDDQKIGKILVKDSSYVILLRQANQFG